MSRKRNQQKAIYQTQQYKNYWVIRMLRIASSAVYWEGLPKTIDPIYMENCLNRTGSAIVVQDEMWGEAYGRGEDVLFCGQNASVGNIDIYGYPMDRRVIFMNGVTSSYSIEDSVIIFNNSMRTADIWMYELMAELLADIDMAIKINTNTQKTMPIIPVSQSQQLSIENLYSGILNNLPYSLVDEQGLNLEAFKSSLQFDNRRSFTSDLMIQVQREIWNRFLTFVGVNNLNVEKRERTNVPEVNSNLDEILMMRRDRLNSRQRAADLMNEQFGTDIKVSYYSEVGDKGGEMNGNLYNNGQGYMRAGMAQPEPGTDVAEV